MWRYLASSLGRLQGGSLGLLANSYQILWVVLPDSTEPQSHPSKWLWNSWFSEQGEDTSLVLEAGSLPRHWTLTTLMLDHPAATLCQNKCLLLEMSMVLLFICGTEVWTGHPTCWTCLVLPLQQPRVRHCARQILHLHNAQIFQLLRTDPTTGLKR